MMRTQMNINPGHIARHTPRSAGAQGKEAAIVDIAQDLLLRYLHSDGVLDKLAFKGGTALRKLYAGTAGRFSLDLDFSGVTIGGDMDDTLMEFITAIDGAMIGPFRYGVVERRGKWAIRYEHDFGGRINLNSKLDINPPPWLTPILRDFVSMPIHKQYGQPPLPKIQTIRLEENVAEKIARLNRATPARDLYDLAWIAMNPNIAGKLDNDLVRRLAVLKIWTDANGVHAGSTWWKPGHEAYPFDPEKWLRDRSDEDFDVEDIGALVVPVPSASELSDAIRSHYGFLTELNADEIVLSANREQERPLALRLLAELPGNRLSDIGLY
jgi:predicted nucleotidyltransferase component of viral defense system